MFCRKKRSSNKREMVALPGRIETAVEGEDEKGPQRGEGNVQKRCGCGVGGGRSVPQEGERLGLNFERLKSWFAPTKTQT